MGNTKKFNPLKVPSLLHFSLSKFGNIKNILEKIWKYQKNKFIFASQKN